MGKHITNYFGPFELSACITFTIIFTMFASKLHDIYKENEIEDLKNVIIKDESFYIKKADKND